jgi:hypothetical protein
MFTKSDIVRISRIAQNVRYWCEDNNPHFPPNLEGMCAIAAGELNRRLQRAGFNSKIVVVEDKGGISAHCFCMVESLIVDVTASQFGDYDVVVVKRCARTPIPWYHHMGTVLQTRRQLTRIRNERAGRAHNGQLTTV